jgi:hypothetical protein
MKKILMFTSKCLAVILGCLLGGTAIDVLAAYPCNCCVPETCFEVVKTDTCGRKLKSNQAVGTVEQHPNLVGYEPSPTQCGQVWRCGIPTLTPCGQRDAIAAC